ncbi:orange carotenoid protein N-terminal domain-containing protein [Leptolyngbya sp. NIES-2104]|uniref:orange carotenoid protein N-terminal domain-containing protein n=1 Tax=Leptolyngbya sp. NIES-2104 TaxID=1552121 RepID=UPI0006ECC554|nr:orange carotenoid protein N-terminal domain-containing protein [Leptolyngbya sp. NIES-2104]GAP95572.1 hypothetical protein NIES2104_20960 [Leptolyngbya sp. NIES-2104]
MTSINTSNLDQAIVEFQSLPVEEKLAVLGFLFKDVSGSIPESSFNGVNSNEITPLIEQIQAQRSDEQIQTLGDFLSSQNSQGDGVALDPHPSKALLELIPGNTQPALTRYKALDQSSRLAFWYQLGQQFSNSIPSDVSLSPKASELLTSLRSLGAEQQAAFLSQIA